jgi:hypothetical protein
VCGSDCVEKISIAQEPSDVNPNDGIPDSMAGSSRNIAAVASEEQNGALFRRRERVAQAPLSLFISEPIIVSPNGMVSSTYGNPSGILRNSVMNSNSDGLLDLMQIFSQLSTNSQGIESRLNGIQMLNINRLGSDIGTEISVGESEDLETRQFEALLHHILMNEMSHAGAPPASKSVLESLKREIITNDTDTVALGECNITQEPFEVGDTMIELPCGHNYKQDSIVHWLEMHNTCPVCRVEIAGVAES